MEENAQIDRRTEEEDDAGLENKIEIEVLAAQN